MEKNIQISDPSDKIENFSEKNKDNWNKTIFE